MKYFLYQNNFAYTLSESNVCHELSKEKLITTKVKSLFDFCSIVSLQKSQGNLLKAIYFLIIITTSFLKIRKYLTMTSNCLFVFQLKI